MVDVMNKENGFKTFFKQLTGFTPYPFQVKCGSEYFNKHSFILNAPTGSGKTWASITPFLYSWYQWKNGKEEVDKFPRKLIYSLPLRILANSLFGEVKNTINDKFPDLKIKVTLQTGEFPNDPYFEGDIIFTTIDQTLSNILGIPFAVSKSLANINAGAVIYSYLVFDEFHLLEPFKSLKTVITLLKEIKKFVPFCIMTATLSKGFVDNISKYLDATFVSINKDEYKSFSYVKKGAKKNVKVLEKSIEPLDIINFHKNKTIVVCNTVDKCINLYKDFWEKRDKRTKVICLHSQFFGSDRKRKEEKILEYFGKNSIANNVVLITTQIIEVGLDISCDVMLTEISPINSFLQRIGRCARWEGNGKIVVFDCEKTYLPYKKDLSLSTLNNLKEINSQELDYFKSLKLIEEVLSTEEGNIFEEIKNSLSITWNRIRDSWRTGDKGFARELIRDIRSISVVLLPKGMKINSLYHFETISMSPFKLKQKIEDFIERNLIEEPVLLGLRENFILDDETFESNEKKLSPVELDVIFSENIVALNSNVIGYSPEFGLDFNNCNIGVISKETFHAADFNFYRIYFDTFREHIEWMLEYLNTLYDYKYFLHNIKKVKYKKYNLIKIIDFIIRVHDYGKLNEKWQSITKEYQKRRKGSVPKDFLAHTDFDFNDEEDIKIMSELGGLPKHSGISAFAAYVILPIILKIDGKDKEGESLVKVISTTVMRHHSILSKQIPKFKISQGAYEFFIDLLKEVYNIDKTKLPDGLLREFDGDKINIISFENTIETFLYFVFVRILRLCDQHSFEYNPRRRSKNG